MQSLPTPAGAQERGPQGSGDGLLHALMSGPQSSLGLVVGEGVESEALPGPGVSLESTPDSCPLTSPPPFHLSSLTTDMPPPRSPLQVIQAQIQGLEQEGPSRKKKTRTSVCLSLVRYLNVCH